MALATLREYPAWFLLPVSNLLFYRLQHWGEGVGHYWTMAVDEQSYLLWPLALAVVGRSTAAFLAIATASLLFRIVWPSYQEAGFVLVLLSTYLLSGP
ncbi:MAG: hypothetical protein ACRYFR_09050 [Janthinobacterium lividum]